MNFTNKVTEYDMLKVMDIVEGKNEIKRIITQDEFRDVMLCPHDMEKAIFDYSVNNEAIANGTMKEIISKANISEEKFLQLLDYENDYENELLYLEEYDKGMFYFKTEDMKYPYVGHVDDLAVFLIDKLGKEETIKLFSSVKENIFKDEEELENVIIEDYEKDCEVYTLENDTIHILGYGAEIFRDVPFAYENLIEDNSELLYTYSLLEKTVYEDNDCEHEELCEKCGNCLNCEHGFLDGDDSYTCCCSDEEEVICPTCEACVKCACNCSKE
ncbi:MULTISPECIES: hypothetical protein [unclassified Bacillus cereus group]|uniref:hypothetical protein n=1 Tax=unclassified Bacillus cereus group TaxID=2750818 RepID=UPI0024C6697B|nr:MAG: hypothetical protein NRZ50_27445 [Bacillus paranthracis]WAI30392.1 MAG: hypothetical protein NRZ52_15875 [Bacillus paranthracis]WAI36318.1 MAG: hypothetical protein NRZ51_16685 [Bacillus paranthracis]